MFIYHLFFDNTFISPLPKQYLDKIVERYNTDKHQFLIKKSSSFLKRLANNRSVNKLKLFIYSNIY